MAQTTALSASKPFSWDCEQEGDARCRDTANESLCEGVFRVRRVFDAYAM